MINFSILNTSTESVEFSKILTRSGGVELVELSNGDNVAGYEVQSDCGMVHVTKDFQDASLVFQVWAGDAAWEYYGR